MPSDQQTETEEWRTTVELELIRVLGLTPNEARLYTVMLQGANFTASSLAKLTGIHRTRTYDNLRGLESKKMTRSVGSEPKRFEVVPPQDAIRGRLQALAEEYERSVHEITALSHLLERYREKRGQDERSTSYVQPIDDAITELRRLLSTASRRLWVSKRTAGGIEDWFALKNEIAELSARGIDVRFLADSPIDTGMGFRSSKAVTLSFALVDDWTVCFFLPESDPTAGHMLVTQDSDYVSFLSNLFSSWWLKSFDD
ncbi:MAG: TrmB family transcriptional regulator [Candidatus Thorarchaeota archaeon]|jgi:sugar-specific transcriptional regulator TrmB